MTIAAANVNLHRMNAMIECSGLRKSFGPTLALDDMSFSVMAGQVTGFVGPNGAGKSTTMRVILGLDSADTGRALIAGRPYQALRHPLSHVGALLDAARPPAGPVGGTTCFGWPIRRACLPSGWMR